MRGKRTKEFIVLLVVSCFYIWIAYVAYKIGMVR